MGKAHFRAFNNGTNELYRRFNVGKRVWGPNCNPGTSGFPLSKISLSAVSPRIVCLINRDERNLLLSMICSKVNFKNSNGIYLLVINRMQIRGLRGKGDARCSS